MTAPKPPECSPERVADERPHPSAGRGELGGRVVQCRGSSGQRRQSGGGQKGERGPDDGPGRFAARCGPPRRRAAPTRRSRPTADGDRRNQEPAPPEEVAEAQSAIVAGRPERVGVEGQPGQYAERDQHHPPQIGGVAGDDRPHRRQQADPVVGPRAPPPILPYPSPGGRRPSGAPTSATARWRRTCPSGARTRTGPPVAWLRSSQWVTGYSRTVTVSGTPLRRSPGRGPAQTVTITGTIIGRWRVRSPTRRPRALRATRLRFSWSLLPAVSACSRALVTWSRASSSMASVSWS